MIAVILSVDVDWVKIYTRIGVIFLLFLIVVFFVGLFFYVVLDSEFAGNFNSYIAVTGKVFILLFPIPLVVLNFRNGLISWSKLLFVIAVWLVMVWVCFFAHPPLWNHHLLSLCG